MRGAWPPVTGSIAFRCKAKHAMIALGDESAVPHAHDYEVVFGWTHEIQPTNGFTHEYREQLAKLRKLVERVDGADLNTVLPLEPSAEILALWLLANTEPAYCDHVIVRCYEGYEVRVDRARQRSEWMRFIAGKGEHPYSTGSYWGAEE